MARSVWYDDGPPAAKDSTAGDSPMKIVIISDIHANSEALGVLPREYDELWILGDLVNYGPNPLEAVEFARAKASLVVRGNHDHSAGFWRGPPLFRPLPVHGRGDGTLHEFGAFRRAEAVPARIAAAG
jgi:predicted phosphodiesterase